MEFDIEVHIKLDGSVLTYNKHGVLINELCDLNGYSPIRSILKYQAMPSDKRRSLPNHLKFRYINWLYVVTRPDESGRMLTETMKVTSEIVTSFITSVEQHALSLIPKETTKRTYDYTKQSKGK